MDFFTDQEIAAEIRALAREADRIADRLDPAGTHPCASTTRNHAPSPMVGQLEMTETGETGTEPEK